MSLTLQLRNLTTRVGTEFKSVRGTIGNLASLSTTEKGSLVGAINELRGGLEAGGTVTVDAITDASALIKAFLKTGNAAAARDAIGAGTSDLTLGTTASTAKAGDYTPSWGEVSSKPAFIAAGATQQEARDAIGAGTSSLTIGTTASTAKAGDYQPTWSQVTSKPAVIAAGTDAAEARTAIGAVSSADVDDRIEDLIGGAPAALDTLGEIATKITENEGEVGGIITALGSRVRVDAAQAFTEPQKAQARSNIGVYSTSEIGDPETDFVAVFEAALV